MQLLPGTSSRYFSVVLLITPNAPITIGIVLVLHFQDLASSMSKSLYLDSFSNVLTEVLRSVGIATSMIKTVWSFLSRTTMSDLKFKLIPSLPVKSSK